MFGYQRPSATALLTAGGLLVTAIGIWIQALSGAPEYPTIPPGPIVLVLVAAATVLRAARWRWLPFAGALLSLLITVGVFVTPHTMNRLRAPEAVGVLAGTLIQLAGLAMANVAGFLATMQQYGTAMPRLVSRFVGVPFVLIGAIMFVRGAGDETMHNLLHFATGLAAAWVGFRMSDWAASRFCIATGSLYLTLGLAGLILGDPTMERMWTVGPLHLTTADHLLHIVLGAVLMLSTGARVVAANATTLSVASYSRK